jgi:choline dehydrogenase
MESDDPVMTQLIGRLAGLPGHPADDAFYLNLFAGRDPYEGRLVSAIMIGDLKPISRGTVTLASADPARPPVADLGFYTAPGDLDRMRAAYRHAWAIAGHPAFARTVAGVPMIDDALVADDERLGGLLRAMTFSRGALLGGARMGAPGDGDAVVDEHCRVSGVDALRVADLSVVPVPLRAPTALDAMMIGEHAAAWIAAGL